MEASMEDGGAPLAGEPEVQFDPVLRGRFVLRAGIAAAFFFLDLVIVPGVLLSGFDFDFDAFISHQAKDFSFFTSMLDWVAICVLRDLALLLIIAVCLAHFRSAPEAACKGLRAVRFVAMMVMDIGIARLWIVEWSDPLWPALVGSSAMLLVTSMASHSAYTSMRSLADEYAKRVQGDVDEPDDQSQQFSSQLTFCQTLKVMKPYFWPSTGEWTEVFWNRVRALSTWVCVIGSKILGLSSPLFLAKATNGISRVLHARQPGEIPAVPFDVVLNLSVYAVLIFLSKMLNECQSLMYIKVQQAAYIEISEMTFAHLHKLSLEWHVKKRAGNVVRSMDRGLAAAQNTMKYCFLYLFPTLGECFAVGCIFVVHFKDSMLAMFVLLNLYHYIFFTVQVTMWRKKFRTATNKHDNELHDRLQDSLTNYETVKYFTAEDYESHEYRKVVAKFQQMSMATQASLSFLNIGQQLIINFTLAGGLIRTVYHMMDGGDIGQFVAVNAYIVQTFAPLSFLGTIYNMVVQALIDMKNFGELLAETSDVVDLPNAAILDVTPDPGRPEPIIEFRKVTFRYPTQPDSGSLKNITFSIPHGGKTALVGSTGSGKTTITRLIFRFYDPVAGEVIFNGRNIRDVTQKSLRSQIGFVPQDVVMFNATVEHNISYGRIEDSLKLSQKDVKLEKTRNATEKARLAAEVAQLTVTKRSEVERVAKEAQLEDFILRQEKQWDTIVGERGLKLSGGEKQRLAIARCLMKNPPIVVLDEATSALDSQTERKIQEALNALSQKRTVVAIAHRLSTIRDFDEVLVLEKGEIIQRGTHDKLLADGGKYHQMWNRQVDDAIAPVAAENET